MPNGPISFPAVLTVDNWKKATDFTKPQHTGMKGLLTSLKQAHGKVDWGKFYAKAVCSKQNGVTAPHHVDEKVEEMKKEYLNSVKPLREQALQLSRKAADLAKDLKKKKLVTKKNTKACTDIDKGALNFATELKDNGVYVTKALKEFEEEKTRLQRLLDIALQKVRTGIASVKADAKKVKANPTVDVYDSGAGSGFYQETRTVGTTLPLIKFAYPKVEAFRPKWQAICNDGFKPTKDEEVLPKLKKVLVLLKELEGIIG